MTTKVETLFDIVPDLHASILDVEQLDSLCRKQQTITMRRIASWLRSQGKMRKMGGECVFSRQLIGLADELTYLSGIPTLDIDESGESIWEL